MSDLGFLWCPLKVEPVPIDHERFRSEVEHQRCPLTGHRTTNWSRMTSGRDGTTIAAPTQQCPCGAQWELHGEFEVAWPSSQMVRYEYPEDD